MHTGGSESLNKDAVRCPSRSFVRNGGLTEQTFYLWSKRFRKPEPMQFALVEAGTAQSAAPKAGPGTGAGDGPSTQ